MEPLPKRKNGRIASFIIIFTTQPCRPNKPVRAQAMNSLIPAHRATRRKRPPELRLGGLIPAYWTSQNIRIILLQLPKIQG
jgi:hypothetical protein